MNASKIRLVTLDLTGTVIQFRKPPFVQYQEVAASYGVESELSSLKRGFHLAWRRQNEKDPHFGSLNHGDSLKWWVTLVHDTMRDALGKSYSQDRVQPIAYHLYKLYSTTTPYEVFPDALEFLKRFQPKRFFKLGVITNFDKRVLTIVQQLGLAHFFDFVVCSENARASKPDPEIFNAAIRVSGLIGLQPQDIVHVGDDVDRDYLGAKAIGWQAWILNRRATLDMDSIDNKDVCKDFTEVTNKLEKHLSAFYIRMLNTKQRIVTVCFLR